VPPWEFHASRVYVMSVRWGSHVALGGGGGAGEGCMAAHQGGGACSTLRCDGGQVGCRRSGAVWHMQGVSARRRVLPLVLLLLLSRPVWVSSTEELWSKAASPRMGSTPTAGTPRPPTDAP